MKISALKIDNEFEKMAMKKYLAREKKKKRSMKVSGAQVKQLLKIIKHKK